MGNISPDDPQLEGIHLTIPPIAQGKVIPDSVKRMLAREGEEQRELKKSRRHDWLITIFSVIGGAVGGFISSLAFWLITK